jgi:hypothetical protein
MTYSVFRVYKDPEKDREIIEDDLTRAEAMEMVQEDVDYGDSSVSMLVFDNNGDD